MGDMGWDGTYQPAPVMRCGRWELELANSLPVDARSAIPTWRQYYGHCLLEYSEAGDGRPGSAGPFGAETHITGGILADHRTVSGPAEAGELFDEFLWREHLGDFPTLDDLLATRRPCGR